MSKLEDLIQKLCPNGVEYFRVDTLCNITRGRVISKEYLRNNIGQYPVYSSQTENEGKLGEISTYDFDGEYITWTTDGAHAGSVFYRSCKFSVTNVCGLLEVKDKNINLTKYIYYILNTQAKKYVNKGMGNPKLMSNVMANIKLPIPPLEIQEEIVHILDSFTELTNELTARKKQYEFYRDSLLTFGDKVEWKKLEDVFIIKNGYTPSKSNKNYWENGTIPWFRMDDIRQNGRILSDSMQHVTRQAVKGNLFPANSIILSTSATIGEHALIKVESLANQRFTYLIKKDLYKDKLDMKFMFYYCFIIDDWCKDNVILGNFPSVDMNRLKALKIPIPPLSKQERIVSILDKFDSLCNDITKGLPAEIEARKKQYEYYRDKLLTFKDISENK